MDKEFADQALIKYHPDHSSQYGKPPQHAVIFLVKHIENTQTAGNPKKEVFQRYPEDLMFY